MAKRCMQWSFWVALLLTLRAEASSSVNISSPSDGSTLSGPIEFTAAGSLPADANVSYSLDGQPIGGPIYASPYRYSWHAFYGLNQSHTLQATARDAVGNLLATSPLVTFTTVDLDAFGGWPVVPAPTLKVVGADPNNLSGRGIRLQLDMPSSSLERLEWFIDGTYMPRLPTRVLLRYEEYPNGLTSLAWNSCPAQYGVCTWSDGSCGSAYAGLCVPDPLFDSTQYLDGDHDIYVQAWEHVSSAPDAGSANPPRPYTVVHLKVHFNNGPTPFKLQSTRETVIVNVGSVEGTETRLLLHDGSAVTLSGCAYSSDSPNATIDANGRITGASEGTAHITATCPSYPGWSTTTRVVVLNNRNVPHFAKNGDLLQGYDPLRSIFVRAPFNLNPPLLDTSSTPGPTSLTPELLRGAGVTSLSTGIYASPSMGAFTSESDWLTNYQNVLVNPSIDIAKKTGFGLVFIGDDVDRTPGELWSSINSCLIGSTITTISEWVNGVCQEREVPCDGWTQWAVYDAFKNAKASGIGTSVEIMDEASAKYGREPRPHDCRWLNLPGYPIPDSAFEHLVHNIQYDPNHLPIVFQVSGDTAMQDPEATRNWMGPGSYSDYATVYSTLPGIPTQYPYNHGLAEIKSSFDINVLRNYDLGVYQLNRPIMLLTGSGGEFYMKRAGSTSGKFTPDVDTLLQYPASPIQVAAEVMYAAEHGAAGVRTYGYDHYWAAYRANDPPSNEEQTGASPFDGGSDRWQALGSAYRLVGTLEPLLLGSVRSTLWLGDSFAVGAREIPNAVTQLFMVTNFSESPQTLSVDLLTYWNPAATGYIRYRLVGATLREESDTNKWNQVTFAPGETIAWRIDTASALPPAVSFSQPLADATVLSGSTVHLEANSASMAATIARVEFWVDGKFVGTASGAPWSFDWNTAGYAPDVWHGVAAIAYDTNGLSSEARIAVLPSTR